jgi:hypothetical protein
VGTQKLCGWWPLTWERDDILFGHPVSDKLIRKVLCSNVLLVFVRHRIMFSERRIWRTLHPSPRSSVYVIDLHRFYVLSLLYVFSCLSIIFVSFNAMMHNPFSFKESCCQTGPCLWVAQCRLKKNDQIFVIFSRNIVPASVRKGKWNFQNTCSKKVGEIKT